MIAFDLLRMLNSELSPANSKVHLATWNGSKDPLDVYLNGEFGEWQRWQSRKNFERQFIVSLVQLPAADRWLFAGVYRSRGSRTKVYPDEAAQESHYYDLEEDLACSELNGRLVVKFSRTGRQPYLNAENWVDQISVAEIRAERLTIGEFPGFRAVDLSRDELKLIFKLSLESWRTALTNVAGIYLISDNASGKLYVGAAYGQGGIWQRWKSYVITGHGDNRELQELLKAEGEKRLNDFRYSVLEVADVHDSEDSIRMRESHWKKILLSRVPFGLNGN